MTGETCDTIVAEVEGVARTKVIVLVLVRVEVVVVRVVVVRDDFDAVDVTLLKDETGTPGLEIVALLQEVVNGIDVVAGRGTSAEAIVWTVVSDAETDLHFAHGSDVGRVGSAPTGQVVIETTMVEVFMTVEGDLQGTVHPGQLVMVYTDVAYTVDVV